MSFSVFKTKEPPERAPGIIDMPSCASLCSPCFNRETVQPFLRVFGSALLLDDADGVLLHRRDHGPMSGFVPEKSA